MMDVCKEIETWIEGHISVMGQRMRSGCVSNI
jgi:hypothetical protein